MEAVPTISTTCRPRMSGGIFLLVVVVALVPLSFVTSVVVDRFPVPYRSRVTAHLSEMVTRHAQTIDRFIRDKRDIIRFLAATADGRDLSDSNRLKAVLEVLQSIHGPVFEDMGFINEKGMQVAYAGPLHLSGARYTGAEWFEAAAGRPHCISDVFPGLRGYPHFIVAARKHWQKETWLLRATIDFNAFVSLVEGLRIGKTGRAFIINREGELQTRHAGPIVRPKEYWRISGQNAPIGPAGGGSHESGEKNGPEKIVLTARMNAGNWLLVFEQDMDDALWDLQTNIRTAGLFFVLGLIATLVLAVYFGTRLEAPLRKNG